MLTMRNDIIRNKKQTICKNSTLLGFSGVTLKYGDFFTYKPYSESDSIYLGKSHGQISPVNSPKIFILGQVVMSLLNYTTEMWIDPEMVTEIVPPQRMSKHIQNFFLEQEVLQDSNTMSSRFFPDHLDFNSLYVKSSMTDIQLKKWLDKNGRWNFQSTGDRVQYPYTKFFLEDDKFVRGAAYSVKIGNKTKIYLRKEML